MFFSKKDHEKKNFDRQSKFILCNKREINNYIGNHREQHCHRMIKFTEKHLSHLIILSPSIYLSNVFEHLLE